MKRKKVKNIESSTAYIVHFFIDVKNDMRIFDTLKIQRFVTFPATSESEEEVIEVSLDQVENEARNRIFAALNAGAWHMKKENDDGEFVYETYPLHSISSIYHKILLDEDSIPDTPTQVGVIPSGNDVSS